MSELKLWAVVIGDKGRNTRYVAYHPDSPKGNETGFWAVYEKRKSAREARKAILADCGHKSVHVIPFESVEP